MSEKERKFEINFKQELQNYLASSGKFNENQLKILFELLEANAGMFSRVEQIFSHSKAQPELAEMALEELSHDIKVLDE